MNFLKKLALVASLALAGTGAAHAAGTYIQMDSGAKQDFENSWTYNTGTGNDTSPGLGETGPAGTTFVDYFQFNVPDDEYVSFSAFGSGVTFKAPVGAKPDAFYGFALFSTGADGSLLDFQSGTIAHTIEGGEWLLTTGTYEIDLYGVFTKADGTYDVHIFGSPVPEPSGWALLLAGLGVTGLLARRRKHQA